ncbi:MAG TPA: SLC13 family permease, partial [Candidatus Binataceae bacterium]|nr:SLC13 family permease [Candidatus Binataceae bacterium]
YAVLSRWFPPDLDSLGKVTAELSERRAALGRMRFEEAAVAVILGATVLAWLLGSDTYGYAGIAIFAVVALFVFNLLSWREVEEYVNWGIILMYGGAIALGAALQRTGAAAFIAGATLGRTASALAMLAILTLAADILGELLSHSAVVAALVPVGLGMAHRFAIDPALMTMAVAVPAGLTFILPVGTPSIALAYSSGFLRRKDLLVPGGLMIAVAWIGLNLMIHWYWPLIGFGAAR